MEAENASGKRRHVEVSDEDRYAVVWVIAPGSREPSVIYCSGHSSASLAREYLLNCLVPSVFAGSMLFVVKIGKWIMCERLIKSESMTHTDESTKPRASTARAW